LAPDSKVIWHNNLEGIFQSYLIGIIFHNNSKEKLKLKNENISIIF